MSLRDSAPDGLWRWFAVSSVTFLVVPAISPAKDLFAEYRTHQRHYRELRLEGAGTRQAVEAARSMRVEIRQIWIPDLDGTVDRCTTCRLGVADPDMRGAPPPLDTRPDVPHVPEDIDTFGCTVCHRGQGRATTREAAHGEDPDWDAPLLPVRYTEASCGRCHLDDEVPEAALLSRGRALLERAGCPGCHEIPGREDWRRRAPRLEGLSRKVGAEWLRAWLSGPSELVEGTWMPDFRLPDDEVEALAAYLWSIPARREAREALAAPAPPRGDAARGRKLFRESRCITCHTVDGKGNGSAPELGTVGSKVRRSWLAAYLRDSHAFQPDTKMPRYAFSEEEIADLVEYAMEELVAPGRTPPPEEGGEGWRPAVALVERGRSLFRRYGCAGCHGVPGEDGTPVRIGPELAGIGDKPVRRLDFGTRDDLPRTREAWLAAKLDAPRSFREDLRMPVFGFDEEEIVALVTALLAIPERDVSEGYRVPRRAPSYAPRGGSGNSWTGTGACPATGSSAPAATSPPRRSARRAAGSTARGWSASCRSR